MQNHANKERENIKSIGEIKAKNLEFLVCTCFYVQYRVCVLIFSSDVRIGCMACPAVVNSKQQLNISAVYSMWVFITIKAQVNVKSGTKTQIERRDEKRKKKQVSSIYKLL